jgi:hypothetical protein
VYDQRASGDFVDFRRTGSVGQICQERVKMGTPRPSGPHSEPSSTGEHALGPVFEAIVPHKMRSPCHPKAIAFYRLDCTYQSLVGATIDVIAPPSTRSELPILFISRRFRNE